MFFGRKITKWVDYGSPMDVVYLDFQKAFDKVPHQRFLLKLKAHGIGNDVINYIEEWLTHRRQRVIVDGEVSNWKSVLSGVPQGSVLDDEISNWKSVLSGVPHGTVLVPILILIYINDLEDDMSSKLLKFADDTKVFRRVTNVTDKQCLQDDLDKLVEWSEKWQMVFKFGRCKCIHIGHGNMDEEYKMGDVVRLLQCGLTTLATRRLRVDQIEVFKIMNGYEDIDRNMFFKLKEGSRTRGHNAALVKEQCKLDMRKYSFSQRVINEWNKLPNNRVNASSVNNV